MKVYILFLAATIPNVLAQLTKYEWNY